MPPPADAFERAYAAPLAQAPEADPREAEHEALEGQARARPDEPFALRGCLLTPDAAIADGWLVVSGATILELLDTAPSAVRGRRDRPVPPWGGIAPIAPTSDTREVRGAYV